MNILGAIFPLKNFRNDNDLNQRLTDRLSLSTYPWTGTCLLRGDADQCFRTLLFQAALSYASIGQRVAFYTPSPLQAFPATVHSLMPLSLESAHLDRIQFHYFSTLLDVHQHLNQISTDVIILDGYMEYPFAKVDDRLQIVATCALLKDTFYYLKQKSLNDDLLLLCSCTCPESSMANVEQLGLFDMAIDIEMCEDGDYDATIHHVTNSQIASKIKFRLGLNEILPLSATVEMPKK